MKLSDLLSSMLSNCRNALGEERVARQLGGGLQLALRVDPGGQYTLKLIRLRTAPSDRELETVLRHWPDGSPAYRPDLKVHTKVVGEYHLLVATWGAAE
jgi:hypothetical protein